MFLITDWIGRHDVLLPIYHTCIHYNFSQKQTFHLTKSIFILILKYNYVNAKSQIVTQVVIGYRYLYAVYADV